MRCRVFFQEMPEAGDAFSPGGEGTEVFEVLFLSCCSGVSHEPLEHSDCVRAELPHALSKTFLLKGQKI